MLSNDLCSVRRDAAGSLGALRRPRRVSVSQGASETLVLDDAGGYSGPWDAATVPYLIEPMDMLASRHHSAVCFVGPARSGKTAGLVLGWMAHAIANDIGRMMIMHMNEKKAQLFSKLDVEPVIEASEKLRVLKSPRSFDNNIGLKVFRHGMAVRFAHPSRAEAAGTTYRYVALTDYDRYTTQKGMGGSMFGSASKRTQTLMSRGMVLVESSPERQYTDATWKPATPHEAPPCDGILGIYNQSDRRRFYWPCPECGEWFEAAPGLSLFAGLPSEEALSDMVRGMDIRAFAREHAYVVCPENGCIITHDRKHEMNTAGKWVADGQTINEHGEVIGPVIESSVAGYWLGGVAAAYQTWASIIENYLNGLREYVLTGFDESLESKTYVDQAMPYFPRALQQERNISAESRGENLARFFVPDQARFLLAFVDVQGGKRARFVVQVHAIGPQMEQWIVDRFDIAESVRGEDFRIDPAAYLEDWAQITERVVKATYRLHDGREMMIRRVGVDLGGEAGVTPNAQAWHAAMVREGFGDRVRLMKGDGSRAGSRAASPVQQSRLKGSNARLATPYLSVQSDYFKDQVAASKRRQSGPAAMHFPSWLKQWFYDELSAEVRGKDGKWRKVSESRANEALDCWVGVNALAYELGANNPKVAFNWIDPPAWAGTFDINPFVIAAEERRNIKQAAKPPPKPRSAPTIGKSGWSSRL